METYVIVHDERLMRNFPFEVKWVKVGNHNKFSGGIIARELGENIEGRPNLLAYTAWYALVHNGYINSDEFYLMLEYDVDLTENFIDVVSPHIKPGRLIGFSPRLIDDKLFFGSRIMDLMIRSIKETYQVDAWEIVDREKMSGRTLWCPSSNCIIQGKDMISYVNWFDRLLPFYRRKPGSAYYHERALRIWMAINDIEPFCIENVLSHKCRLSHRIRYPVLKRED